MTSTDFENDASFSKVQSDTEDPVETMIKKTGCMDFHYKVQVEVTNVIGVWQWLWLRLVVNIDDQLYLRLYP